MRCSRVHVVRRGEDLAERRPAEHDRVSRGVVETVGQVRLALADAREAERRLELRHCRRSATASAGCASMSARCAHRIVHPPSIVITCPVQYDDASDARKRSTPSSSSIRPGPSHRALALEPAPRALVLEQLGGHLAREPPRRDRVHAHAVGRPLRRELAGEPVHGALRGDVARVRDGRRGDGAEHRADVDHRAGALLGASGSATACETAKSASRLTRRTERKPSRVAWRSGPPDEMPGVVDADVDAAEPLERRPRRAAPDRPRRSRRSASGWIAGVARGELLEPLDPARGGDDLGARLGEHGREAGAEPARGAGDDRPRGRRGAGRDAVMDKPS